MSASEQSAGPSMARKLDMQMLLQHPPHQLLQVLLAQVDTANRADGLWFDVLAEALDAEVAEELQRKVQIRLGADEAGRLCEALELEERGLLDLVTALKHSSWSLAIEHKHYELSDEGVRVAVQCCPWGNAGAATDAPCRAVRRAYLSGFLQAFNPDLSLEALDGEALRKAEQEGPMGCAWLFRAP